MIFYNPTGFKVELKADGRDFTFNPFESHEIYEGTQIRTLKGTSGFNSNAYRDYGIVCLDYNNFNQKKFKTYKEFKKSICKESLMKLKLEYHKHYLNEQQAQVEMKQYKASEIDKFSLRLKQMKANEDSIQKWIDQVEDETHPLFDEFKIENKFKNLSSLSAEEIEYIKNNIISSESNTNTNNPYTGKKRGRKPSIDSNFVMQQEVADESTRN